MLAVAAIPSIKKASSTIKTIRTPTSSLTTDEVQRRSDYGIRQVGTSSKLDEAKKADQERVKGAFQAVAVINQTYLRDVETAKSANKALVEDTERSLDKIVNASVQFIEAITKAITDSQEAIRDSNRRIADFKLEKSDLAFNRQTSNFSDAQKVFALVQRAAQTANASLGIALEAAFRSGNKGDQDAAQRLFDRASSELQTAKGLAQGNKGLEAKVFNEQNALLDKRIGIEQRINNLQLQRQAALRNEKTEQEKVVTELREQAKIAVDNTGIFDKNGDKFDEAQLAKRAAAREEGIEENRHARLPAEGLRCRQGTRPG
jgi:hypothetical protein